MTVTLQKKRDDAFEAVKSFRAQHADNMDDDQFTQFKALINEVEQIDAKMDEVRDRNGAAARLAALEQKGDDTGTVERRAKSLGEHFVKEAQEKDILSKAASGVETNFSATEYGAKAAESPAVIGGTAAETGGFMTTFNRTIVNQRREELVMADIMGSAAVSTPNIKYLVEKFARIAEGAAASVAEAGKKPYIRYNDFDVVMESLSKIAALAKISDETIEDASFVADYINNSLIYDLSVLEEGLLLKGDGTGSNLTGLLNREGIQTAASASQENWFDDLYKAGSRINRTTPLRHDGYVMNDVDYEVLRLEKDANGQYIAGGPFQGQYGVGQIMINPPVWGKRTVVTPEIPVGTALAGSFRQGSIVLRKGGIRVDAVKTNVDDFEHNLVTMRAEERLGLMVPIPAAFVEVTLGGATEIEG
ncbi:phage major capsid protein [Corynebacterium sp.]|uniref:phage major capsid protein n=1 Tax=Corynebacterium sp. TaxID=1720 RepID=UPI0028AD9898|nr:phage major capsid protein [Corynebacterium sp.]